MMDSGFTTLLRITGVFTVFSINAFNFIFNFNTAILRWNLTSFNWLTLISGEIYWIFTLFSGRTVFFLIKFIFSAEEHCFSIEIYYVNENFTKNLTFFNWYKDFLIEIGSVAGFSCWYIENFQHFPVDVRNFLTEICLLAGFSWKKYKISSFFGRKSIEFIRNMEQINFFHWTYQSTYYWNFSADIH